MDMDFGFDFAFNDLTDDSEDISSFGLVAVVSTAKDCKKKDFDNIVQILDEDGNEVNVTHEKFIEMFDQHGLNSFIL